MIMENIPRARIGGSMISGEPPKAVLAQYGERCECEYRWHKKYWERHKEEPGVLRCVCHNASLQMVVAKIPFDIGKQMLRIRKPRKPRYDVPRYVYSQFEIYFVR